MLERLIKEEIVVKGLPKAVSHYVDAVRYGDLVFISGLCGYDPVDGLAGSDAASQSRKAFELMSKVLDRVGASFKDILKLNVYMTDLSERDAVNEVRKLFFGDSYPASTLVQVSALVHPALKIEIEATVGLPR